MSTQKEWLVLASPVCKASPSDKTIQTWWREKKTSGVTRLLRLWAASHLDRLHSTVNNWVTAKDILMMQMISKLGQMISNIFNQKMWKYCNPSCSVNYRSTSNACITQNGSQDPAKSLLQLPSNGGPPCLELCFLTLPLVIEANSDIVTPVIDIFKLKLCCVLLKSGHGRVKNFWGWQIPLMEAKRCEKEGEGDANWEFPETPHGFNRFLLRCLFRTFHTLISLVAFEKLSGVPTVCIERGSHQKCKFPEGTLWFENRLLKPKERAKFTLQKENLKHFEFMLPSFLTTHEMNTSAKQVVAEVRGVAGEKRLNPSSPPRHLEIHLMKPQMKRN